MTCCTSSAPSRMASSSSPTSTSGSRRTADRRQVKSSAGKVRVCGKHWGGERGCVPPPWSARRVFFLRAPCELFVHHYSARASPEVCLSRCRHPHHSSPSPSLPPPHAAMERQLRYFRASLEAHGIPIAREKRVESFFRSAGNDGDEDGVGSDDGATAGSTLDDAAVAEQQAQAGPFHPEARRRLAEELREREESLKISLRMESDLSRSHNRILAQRSVVQTAQSYFNGGSRRSGGGSRRRKARDAAAARSSRDTAFPDDDDDDAGSSDFRFEHVMGVLHAGKQPAFERLLHRVLRSLNFKLHFAKCLEPGTEDEVVAFVDPETGAIGVEKVVFIISLRGENMRKKIVRICQAFEAEAVEVSDLDRHALEDQLQAVDEDIGRTLQLVDSNRDVTREAMTSIASQIVEWGWIVAREKEIFVEMSKFASSGGHHMRGVGWVVKRFFGEILSELGADSQRFPNTHCTPVSTARGPWPKAPTHFFTNKFTAVFQGLVDTYGVPRYREINPALFTAITFPFIFGVMYGDIGHGFILTLAGAFLLLKEQEWSARKLGEMEAMAFGGRYLLFMMGIFAMYCGFIYNDMFALGLNIFTVGWKEPVAGTKEFRRGGYLTSETYEPYIFGLDPTWKRAENDLNFQNSFKMKLSVIFGITQMTAGLVLRLLNSIYSVARPSDRVGEGLVDVLFEVLPQLVFMISIFGYLVVLIFIKWCTDWDVAQQCGQGAPFTEAFFKAPGTAWTKMDTDRCALEQTATNACFFPAMSRCVVRKRNESRFFFLSFSRTVCHSHKHKHNALSLSLSFSLSLSLAHSGTHADIRPSKANSCWPRCTGATKSRQGSSTCSSRWFSNPSPSTTLCLLTSCTCSGSFSPSQGLQSRSCSYRVRSFLPKERARATPRCTMLLVRMVVVVVVRMKRILLASMIVTMRRGWGQAMRNRSPSSHHDRNHQTAIDKRTRCLSYLTMTTTSTASTRWRTSLFTKALKRSNSYSDASRTRRRTCGFGPSLLLTLSLLRRSGI